MNLRERALSLLARREHSAAELARKLAPHGEEEEIAALLERLREENLLSHARFAEALAHSRRGRHGSVRLKAELREKGVEEALIGQVVADARSHDLEAARALWRKKFGEPAPDAAGRAKQIRFLLGRGFPLEVARRAAGGEEAAE